MKNKNGLIADIQRASFHDGKGIRTTVFLKGCPLNCVWCHNPECISFEKQQLFYPEKCIGCGKCSEGCYAGAKTVCGKEMTPMQVYLEILKDGAYYKSNGGVTFSGGEPMAQKGFLEEMLDMCSFGKINCAIETSLIYYDKNIFKKINLIMADFKIWDSETHHRYTGVRNEAIKENFIKTNEIGVPIIARTPVIPGINQGIDKISEFLSTLKNVYKYELLPYHPLGISKGKAIGREMKEFEIPSEEYMRGLKKYAYIR